LFRKKVKGTHFLLDTSKMLRYIDKKLNERLINPNTRACPGGNWDWTMNLVGIRIRSNSFTRKIGEVERWK